jgi:hypothetical protein
MEVLLYDERINNSSKYASGGQGALFEKTAPWTPTKTSV